MIRQVTTALKQHYQERKYSGGSMCRVSRSPESYQYDSQILQQTLRSPSSRTTSHVTLHRHYRSNVPILKPAKWLLFHELLDVHQLMQHIKKQHLYLQTIHKLLKTISHNYHNHAHTPHLVLSFFAKPSPIKALERTPTIPVPPRSEEFNPLQIVVGTLVGRKCIHPESNQFYQPQIQRARLTPNPLTQSELEKYGGAETIVDLKEIRRYEYNRQYKLDSDDWYTYWPKTRHTKQAKQGALERFIERISENEHWCIPTEIYQKQGPGTWTLAPPPSPTFLVDHELRERESLAKSLYKDLFQLTH